MGYSEDDGPASTWSGCARQLSLDRGSVRPQAGRSCAEYGILGVKDSRQAHFLHAGIDKKLDIS